jgi:hypothetical protein
MCLWFVRAYFTKRWSERDVLLVLYVSSVSNLLPFLTIKPIMRNIIQFVNIKTKNGD